MQPFDGGCHVPFGLLLRHVTTALCLAQCDEVRIAPIDDRVDADISSRRGDWHLKLMPPKALLA
jgi:hypothetical protein